VGGVYRDRGMEVLSKWLNTLFQSRVDAAYQNLRKPYLLPPDSSTLQQPIVPTARYPTPDRSLGSQSQLAENPLATRPKGIDRPNRRRRRSSSPSEDGSENAGKQGDERFHRGYHIEMTSTFVARYPVLDAQREVRRQVRTGPKT
jgi:hypothetical protein